MHCKHCGNQIENDSKFCSFCGGVIDSINQNIQTAYQIVNRPSTESAKLKYNTSNRDLVKYDRIILLTFFAFVGPRLFWFFNELYNKINSTTDLDVFINYVIKPSIALFWTTPILLAFASKRKEQCLILFLIGLATFVIYLYQIYSL